MATFTIHVNISKPAGLITKALNNPDNFPYWQTDLEKFEVVRGGPNKVGSVGHLHFSQNGKKHILKDKLIYCVPGKKYISEVSGDAIHARVETTLESINDSTKMTLTWTGKPKILPLKLLFPFIESKIAKQAQKELDTFKHLVETRGADFSKSN